MQNTREHKQSLLSLFWKLTEFEEIWPKEAKDKAQNTSNNCKHSINCNNCRKYKLKYIQFNNYIIVNWTITFLIIFNSNKYDKGEDVDKSEINGEAL